MERRRQGSALAAPPKLSGDESARFGVLHSLESLQRQNGRGHLQACRAHGAKVKAFVT